MDLENNLPGFRIKRKILTDMRILQTQQIQFYPFLGPGFLVFMKRNEWVIEDDDKFIRSLAHSFHHSEVNLVM